MNDLLDVDDLTTGEIEALFDLTDRMKRDPGSFVASLPNRTLLMLFAKPSTRTRLSFEAGMTQLGGHAIDLAQERSQIERGEPLRDVAAVASRYVDAIMARLYAHEDILELAAHADVPVVNGLTDFLHPCQALADLYTMRERGLSSLAYLGDGNNVAHSLMQACAKLGVPCTVATPPGYEPDETVRRRVEGTDVRVTDDPVEAVAGVDAVYTDAWVSMGQEGGAEKPADFQGFQVNAELMGAAGEDAVFMHCLPAHRGEEVAADVIDGPRSIVYDQAENRLHVQKAVLYTLLGDGEE